MINKPTCQELIDKSNNKINNPNDEITSRYTLIMGVAKEAKRLINDQNPAIIEDGRKALSVAVDEFEKGSVWITKEISRKD